MAFDGQHREDGPKLNALLRLADIVEKKEGRQYEHAYFGKVIPSCGTSACMLGWATLEMGEELGLAFDKPIEQYGAGAYPVHVTQRESYEDDEPYEAGARAFNITLPEAEALFGLNFDSPNNGAEAAALLRKFVAAKVKETA